MKIRVTIDDITRMKEDVIVNAANPALIHGGGVCGAIHKAAGPRLEQACISDYPMGIHTGEAVNTEGYELPAKWVIHTVGPKYAPVDLSTGIGNTLLARCYINSLSLAAKLGAKSIAFPAISTGIYGFPPEAAAVVAAHAIVMWMEANPSTTLEYVYLVAFNEAAASILREAVGAWDIAS